jgi:hypothetical protein
VCLAFAMTINKAQRQTLGTVGVDLISGVWTWSVLCWCVKGDKLEQSEGIARAWIAYSDVLLRAAAP